MTLVSLLLVFFLSWWLVWMMVLPLGVRSRFEGEIAPEKSYESLRNCIGYERNGTSDVAGERLDGDLGAPLNPNLPKKLLLTTCISLGFVAVFWMLMEFGFIVWFGDLFMEWVTEFVTRSGSS